MDKPRPVAFENGQAQICSILNTRLVKIKRDERPLLRLITPFWGILYKH